MTRYFIILVGVVLLFSFLSEFFNSFSQNSKKLYKYKRKDFLLTRAEYEFYLVLKSAIEEAYLIFPQVHLSSLLDHKIPGQNWKAAFSHISQKSVDFMLCDKQYLKPVLAIEVDDNSHQREDRIVRDGEVERILQNAGIPLLRFQNHGSFIREEVKDKIDAILNFK